MAHYKIKPFISDKAEKLTILHRIARITENPLHKLQENHLYTIVNDNRQQPLAKNESYFHVTVSTETYFLIPDTGHR